VTDRREEPTRALQEAAAAATTDDSPVAKRAPVESAPPPIESATLPASGLQVVDVIGVGGMGVVYRAKQTELERQIAYKRLLNGYTAEAKARFMREARLTAQLDHPNIVPVHLLDPGSATHPGGYAMKLVEGKTLSRLLGETRDLVAAGKPLDDEHDLETRLEIFLRVCDAIAFAHERRIIHRDIKPANIMIGKFGAIYVMDWGIARPFGEDVPDDRYDELAGESPPTRSSEPNVTRAGMVVGSLQYMSPEQARGENSTLDGKSDQYSLGLLLHELVSLKPAYGMYGEMPEAEVHKKVSLGDRPLLDAIDGKPARVPRELRAIVVKATELNPKRRYDNVRDLADDVRRFMRGEEVRAWPEGPLDRLLRFIGRHRRATLTAFLVVLVAAAAAVGWSRYRNAQSELSVRERGAELTAFYSDIARQAHRIDDDLFRMERALEGLATAAEWALVGPEPTGELARVYFDEDFKDPARRPPDFTKNTAYRWPVSVTFPVVGLAPGIDREATMPRIRRLAPLRQHMTSMVVAAAVGDQTMPNAAEAMQIMLSRKSLIDYTYIDTPEGVHMVWPGIDALPPGYDVRVASFYTMSANKHGTRWGAPYVDSTTDSAGDDLVLPCTRGLWSPTGEFLGVAGVEMTVTKMVETSMVVRDRKVRRASLVTPTGDVIVDSRDANRRFKASGKDEAVELSPFDLPAITAAIRAGEVGLRETTRDGVPIAVAFIRLEAIGWYFVVEVDSPTLGAR
jgi:eukaryotic-like serine/threonine-protein kinase